jgi:succinate dehydrogenase/fumarate reductase iron-sulfur protein
MINIRVYRYNPEIDQSPRLEDYVVPVEEKGTVLGALLHIYEQSDPTLAFRFGCRFMRCGVCALEVDGKPRLACITRARKGMKIEPLHNLQVIRDLVVDRSWIITDMRRLEMYIPEIEPPPAIFEPLELRRLAACNECLACTSTCTSWRQEMDSVGSPFHFVKLAQLYFDPRDYIDRRDQARTLGIERCSSCLRCYCVLGIPIVSMAIKPLLGC